MKKIVLFVKIGRIMDVFVILLLYNFVYICKGGINVGKEKLIVNLHIAYYYAY
jgi:hypothetical protein